MTALLGPMTGIGQMVQAVASGLATDPTIKLHGYAVSRRGGDRLKQAAPAGVSTSVFRLPARVVHELWQHADWPRLAGFDVVHGPNFVVAPAKNAVEVVTIHDLTAWRWPELVTAASRNYPKLVDRAIQRGAVVHAVSDFVAAEVQELLHLPPERVRRIYNGVGEPLPADIAAGRALAGGRDYVLAVGTIEPRKDYPTLVRSFSEVQRQFPDVRLVIAGGDGWGSDELSDAITKSGLGESVLRLGYVSDVDRRNLTAGASCFVYPSKYEGFGLPPLEAMSYGVPVVATRAGAVPEVVGDAASLVAVGDCGGLAASIIEVLSNSDLRLTLSARGASQVERYRWNYTLVELTAWYRELIG